jgi:hypothetical protein
MRRSHRPLTAERHSRAVPIRQDSDDKLTFALVERLKAFSSLPVFALRPQPGSFTQVYLELAVR